MDNDNQTQASAYTTKVTRRFRIGIQPAITSLGIFQLSVRGPKFFLAGPLTIR
jgi:hypothetical protein